MESIIKKHLSVFIILTFHMFVRGQADSVKKVNTDKVQLSNLNIIGVWTNCKTNYNGITMMANACRIIEFKLDGTAIVTYPSQEREVINWEISKNQLHIHVAKENTNTSHRMFNDSNYTIYLTQNLEDFSLELQSEDKEISYFLRRHLN